MLALISFKAFIALYCFLCIQYINALKINITYDYRFNNTKSKRYLYYVDKKESCVLVNTSNFFSFSQFLRYFFKLSPVLIIAIASEFHYIKV